MSDINIKDLVMGNNMVNFSHYRQGIFYYYVSRVDGTEIFSFPVPREDIGTATLKAEDKALTFMRWIRKAISDKTLIKEE